MSERLYGSLDVTEIFKLMQGGHTSVSKSEKNGKIYMNVVVWLNDTEDQYGQIASIQPSPHKNASEVEKAATKKIYIGNLKMAKPEPIGDGDVKAAAAAFNQFGGAPAQQQQTAPVQQNGNGQQPAQTSVISGPVNQPVGNTGNLPPANDGLPF